jgi:hypothetical protein
MLYVCAMTFGPSIASAAPQFAALSGHTGAEYKQQQNFRDLLLNRNYVILISTKYVSCYQEHSKLVFFPSFPSKQKSY